MPAKRKRISSPPRSTRGDAGYAIAKAAIGSIPVAGHALAVLMEKTIAAPLEKRREAWLIELGKTVNQICERVDGMSPGTSQRRNSRWA